LQSWKIVSAYVEGSNNFLEFSVFALGRLRVCVDIREQENRRAGDRREKGEGKVRNLVAFWRRLVRMWAIQLEAGLGGSGIQGKWGFEFMGRFGVCKQVAQQTRLLGGE